MRLRKGNPDPLLHIYSVRSILVTGPRLELKCSYPQLSQAAVRYENNPAFPASLFFFEFCVFCFAPCVCNLCEPHFPQEDFDSVIKRTTMPIADKQATARPARALTRTVSRSAAVSSFRVPPFSLVQNQDQEPPVRQAELFYLQKQIQAQTPMVLVLEDGELVEGCIEWYDRNVLKLRGRTKTLVYKAAIKYMYKLGDSGQ